MWPQPGGGPGHCPAFRFASRSSRGTAYTESARCGSCDRSGWRWRRNPRGADLRFHAILGGPASQPRRDERRPAHLPRADRVEDCGLDVLRSRFRAGLPAPAARKAAREAAESAIGNRLSPVDVDFRVGMFGQLPRARPTTNTSNGPYGFVTILAPAFGCSLQGVAPRSRQSRRRGGEALR